MTFALAKVVNSSSIIVRPRRVSVFAGRKAVMSSLTFTLLIDIAQYTQAAANTIITSIRWSTMNFEIFLRMLFSKRSPPKWF